MMPTLYLVDGNSYLYRAYYAIKRLSNSAGFPTNAIYGFTTMILKILREKAPDYFAIVFDSPAPTKRHREYEAYKAHRPRMPDDLAVQVQPIKDIIRAFNIASIEIEGCEADDVLGTIAKRAEKEGLDIYIVTADKDINQVVSPHIRTYDTMRDRVTEEKDVIERFGVEPSRFPEIMALMGDASDNIPGVPGIGEKTAVGLLKEFGTLDNLIRNRAKIKKQKLKEAVSENLDTIKLSLQLATIDVNVPLDIPTEEFEPKEPEWARLLEFFTTFEFRSLLKLIPEHRSGGTEQTKHCGSGSTEYISVLDKETFETAIAEVATPRDRGGPGGSAGEIAIDTETTSRSPMAAELVGVSFSAVTDRAYYVPLAHSYVGVPTQLPKEYVLERFKEILENPEIGKIGHNVKYDLIVLNNAFGHSPGRSSSGDTVMNRSRGFSRGDCNIANIAFDTMIASYLLNPSTTNHNLDDVAMAYLSVRKISYEGVTDRGRKIFHEVSIEDATRYSGEDASVTLKLKNVLEPLLEKEGLSRLFHTIEMPLTEVLADMELAGVKIDSHLMNRFSKELQVELSAIEKRIYALAGEEFNINSPKQLQEILFRKLGLRTIKKTKTGFSTDVDVLQELAPEHELPKEILEHRTLSKLKNTYVDALPKLVNVRTGRVHTSFNQTITATGRLSSSDPNLQNIPVRGEWGKRIREAFVAEEGYLLMSSDYSQIELRILAHLSRDEGFIDIFRNNGDIHVRTACELYGSAAEDVTSEMRRIAKTVNFGIIYGISPFGLSRQLGIHPEEAKQYIDTYFLRHRGVREYIEQQIRQATGTGSVTTMLGRKRAIPELRSTNRTIRQLGERLAMNTPIQGSAADIIKVAMINIWRRLRGEGLGTKMLLQVHDELLFEVPAGETELVQRLVREEMENAAELLVPLRVDIGVGSNWAAAH